MIDEFPFFSFYLADLHPHVLVMPFALLAIGLCLQLYLYLQSRTLAGPAYLGWFVELDSTAPRRLSGRPASHSGCASRSFGSACCAFGEVGIPDIWDFPIYVGLFSAVYTFRAVPAAGLERAAHRRVYRGGPAPGRCRRGRITPSTLVFFASGRILAQSELLHAGGTFSGSCLRPCCSP